jgi:hypothetical protein
MQEAGDVAIAVGLAGAAGAAVSGLTDWSETSGHARRTGLVHGLLNIAATTLYATAFVLRKRGARGTGQSCALAGYTIALGAAWLGGDLVYDQRVGVMHAVVDEPESFTAVARSADIPEGSMRRVRHDDLDLLIVDSTVGSVPLRIRVRTWVDRYRRDIEGGIGDVSVARFRVRSGGRQGDQRSGDAQPTVSRRAGARRTD